VVEGRARPGTGVGEGRAAGGGGLALGCTERGEGPECCGGVGAGMSPPALWLARVDGGSMDVAVVAGGLGLTEVVAMLGGALAQADGWTERCTTGTSSGDYPSNMNTVS
jgi:hypothetical protein